MPRWSERPAHGGAVPGFPFAGQISLSPDGGMTRQLYETRLNCRQAPLSQGWFYQAVMG